MVSRLLAVFTMSLSQKGVCGRHLYFNVIFLYYPKVVDSRRRPMNHKHKHVSTFFCLVCIFFLHASAFSQSLIAINTENSSLLRYEADDVLVGSLKHIIRINNPAYSKVVGGKLFVPLIRNETARHYVILYNVSSSMGQPTILSDDSGNSYANWSSITIEGQQTFTVEINYCVLSFSVNYLINSSLITDYDKSSDLYKKYTRQEELIQSDNLKIISKAQALTSGEDNTHEKVSKIYNFVIAHMRYAAQVKEMGALWALENGVGDCSEYSYLFVALCRAAGIPARVQAGFAFHSVSETLEDGHMWAEYYLENYGWVPVDATWGLFDALDHRHFSSIQSIPDIPYANYVFNYTTEPKKMNETQTVSIKPSSADVFGDPFAENAVKTVQKVKEVKFALFLARVFGATLIFSSEAEKAEQALLESQIKLQNAIDSWETSPQLAQSSIADALESAEEAVQCGWMLIVKTFILFIGVLTVVVLVALVVIKRYQAQTI